MKRVDSEAKEKLYQLIDSVPELQRNHPKWLQCVAYADSAKWRKALDCLVEVAATSAYYFSEPFWIIISETALLLNIKNIAATCQKQIALLKDDNVILPLGWTSKKLENGTFEVHIAQKLKEDWNTARRREDNIVSLIYDEGFHFKPHGKVGYVYYVRQRKITEVEWHEGEIIGATFSKYWVFPEKSLLTDEEFQEIYAELKEWAATKHISFRY